MRKRRVIVWFRQDLRLHDNEALSDAMGQAEEILPVYIFDPRTFCGKTMFGFPKTGIARARFVIESVTNLRESLQKIGSDLIVRTGKPEEEIFRIAHLAKTSWVFCNRERTQEEIVVQDALEQNLWSIGQEVRFSRGKMLYYTADLPFPVTHTPDHFATFRKETERIVQVRAPLDTPEEIPRFTADISTGTIPSITDFHETDTGGIQPVGTGGEESGLNRLQRLSAPDQMPEGRCLSPWLSQGCLSPKRIYQHIRSMDARIRVRLSSVLTGLYYRDYLRLMVKKYGNAIFQKGGTTGQPPDVSESDRDRFWLWAKGMTGLPIIDAAMHQLAQTGFMPHKARELCAHFLISELGVAWRLGASYFESALIDYDPCSNWVNWANIAGVGPDSREERKINYILQAKRLDADGSYVRKWIPALRNADHQWIHQPDQAPEEELTESHIHLGRDYPRAVLSTDRWQSLS